MSLRTYGLAITACLALCASLFACGDTGRAPRCLRSNCAGCCDNNGACQPGSNPAACGLSAVSCQICSGGQSCIEGGCIDDNASDAGHDGGKVDAGFDAGTLPDAGPICGPSNCQGCCDNNACQAGNVHAACGKQGQACQKCTVSQACVIGACSTPPCQGCKDNGGICQPGNLTSACGSSGNTCAVCTGAQVCNGFSCVGTPSCNSSNCPGCCQNNTCVTQQTNSVCGVNGAACVACMGSNICQLGVCAQPYDAGSGPCGSWNCPGCCEANGTCRGGNAILACGDRGEACQVCLVCIDKICVF